MSLKGFASLNKMTHHNADPRPLMTVWCSGYNSYRIGFNRRIIEMLGEPKRVEVLTSDDGKIAIRPCEAYGRSTRTGFVTYESKAIDWFLQNQGITSYGKIKFLGVKDEDENAIVFDLKGEKVK